MPFSPPLDIIGDSVYSEYAELRQIKKQTSRIFSGDRLNAARVRELGAHVRGRLRTHVSPCPYLRGQSTPARRWWWSERDALQLCRERSEERRVGKECRWRMG